MGKGKKKRLKAKRAVKKAERQQIGKERQRKEGR